MNRKVFVVLISSFLFLSFTKAQVSLQTGTPEIAIPIFSLADVSNSLQASVSLNYVGGSGIRVDGVASPIGTGWEVFAGGSITRITNGEPDDQKSVGSYSPYTSPTIPYTFLLLPTPQQEWLHYQYVMNYFPNGYLYSDYDATVPVTNGGAFEILQSMRIKDLRDPKFISDRELDVFQFDFNGRSGTFSIAKTTSFSDVVFHNLKDSKLKVKIEHDINCFSSGIRTTIKKFIVTDEQGVEYVYEDMELNEAIKYEKRVTYLNGNMSYVLYNASVSVPPLGNAIPIMEGVGTNQYVCNRWMLTKIVNPLTNVSLSFAYNTVDVALKGSHTVSDFKFSTNNSISVHIGYIHQKLKRVKSISNQFGERIEFQYGSSRNDLAGDQVLQNISKLNGNTVVGEYIFEHGYFYKKVIRPLNDNFQASDMPFLRLCLNTIQKKGMDSDVEPPTVFEYNLDPNSSTSIYPPAFCFFKDHWGYFNAGGSNTVAGFDESYIPETGKPYSNEFYQNAIFIPDQVRGINNLPVCFAANGLIKSYTSPQGAKTEFEYEHNKCLNNSTSVNAGGARVKNVRLFDADGSLFQNLNYAYILENGNSSGWGFEPPIYKEDKVINVEKCSSGNGGINTSLSGLAQSASSSYKTIKSARGMPSSYMPKTIAIGIALQVFIPMLVSLFSSTDPSQDFNATISSSEPINYVNSLPLNYSRVEVIKNATNIYLGKEVFEFTSPEQYPVEIPVLLSPYSARQRLCYWKYGLPLRNISYDANNVVVKRAETQFVFNPLQLNLSPGPWITSQKWVPSKIQTTCRKTLNDVNNHWITSEKYEPLVGKIDLLQTDEYLHLNGGASHISTGYEYESIANPSATFLPKLKWTFNSKNEKIETVIKYVNDYNVSGAINTLKQPTVNNITSPVLTETYLYKGGIKKLLSGSIIEYGVVANGNIKPIKTYAIITDRPIDDNSLIQFSNTQLVRDPNYYKPIMEMLYDEDGNLVQTNKIVRKKVNNVDIDYVPSKSATILDRTRPYLAMATVNNSGRSDVAYTSFETPMDASTNWSYNEGLVNNSDWITGQKCLALDQNIRSISRQSLNPGIKYKVSFWAKNVKGVNFIPGVNKNNEVNSADVLINILPTKIYTNPVTQWSLYECYITNASSINVNNQSASNSVIGVPVLIDELKLYPEGATMTSSTYNILGLPTSVVDANNKIQYTEYDGLGRVVLLRDEEKNILKTYEYNFKK